jgi:superfamily II DNA helicase RecQ
LKISIRRVDVLDAMVMLTFLRSPRAHFACAIAAAASVRTDGCAGERAHCVLLYRPGDLFKQTTRSIDTLNVRSRCYPMVSFAAHPFACRRVLLSMHFNEAFDAANCNRMCDHCIRFQGDNHRNSAAIESNPLITVVDTTDTVLGLLKYLQKLTEAGKKATHRQLVDAMKSRSKQIPTPRTYSRVDPVSGKRVNAPFTRSHCEHLLVSLLLDGLLDESFTHTAYSTNSYLIVNAKAADQLVHSGSRYSIRFHAQQFDDGESDEEGDDAESEAGDADESKSKADTQRAPVGARASSPTLLSDGDDDALNSSSAVVSSAGSASSSKASSSNGSSGGRNAPTKKHSRSSDIVSDDEERTNRPQPSAKRKKRIIESDDEEPPAVMVADEFDGEADGSAAASESRAHANGQLNKQRALVLSLRTRLAVEHSVYPAHVLNDEQVDLLAQVPAGAQIDADLVANVLGAKRNQLYGAQILNALRAAN